jgi:hypothetical protein
VIGDSPRTVVYFQDSNGAITPASAANPLPTTSGLGSGGLTDTQLRATPLTVTGPLTDAQLRASAVPVSGAFYQATQPISGAISFTAPQHVIVDSVPTTAVTGTFWQSTQPVSIAGTVATSLASTTITGSVAVTGTFWQATQPVSGTFWQATQPVSGTFWQATQPVSLASTTITGSVAVTGSFWQATQPISAAALPLPTGAATDATLTGRGAFSRLTDGTNDVAVKAANVLPQPTDTAVVVTVRDREPSAPSYTLQLALIEEMRALRRSLALNSNAFIPIPDGPAFWAQ